MRTSFQIFVLIFLVIIIIWIIIQIAIFKTCFHSNNYVPVESQSSCQREQSFLLHHVHKVLRSEPQCEELFETIRNNINFENLPVIYVVTPTYARPVQKAELTRLSHTLMLVPNVHWIIIEDSVNRTTLVTNFVNNLNIPFTHLNTPTPPPMKMKKEDPNWLKPKGVLQRNLALKWLRKYKTLNDKGVVYFADDDNVYDLELFEEMRKTMKVSVWPVGLVGGLMVERPHVKEGKVVGWNTLWKANRPFPIDMAGFAVNLTLLIKHPEATFSLSVPRGYQESKLLRDLVTVDQLEPRANNCTKVLVWHTRTEYPKLKQEMKLSVPSNLNIEV